jgi:adenylosuccinate synthase
MEEVMNSKNVTIIGLQWGDEGKGKIVDAVARSCRYVVRYCGGANAGHSVKVAGEKFALHLVPCGILHKGVINVIGNGVAYDPGVGLAEINELRRRGVAVGPENLRLASSAHLVMPYHKLQDSLSEQALGQSKIGTTVRGIGPCYADKAMRSTAIRLGDLLQPEIFTAKLRAIVDVRGRALTALYNAPPLDAAKIAAEYLEYGRQLAPMICNAGAMLRQACQAGERILFEGGQGSMLDVDHGTYPFVTSSCVSASGVPQGSGVSPKAVGYVLGVAKGYTSRVGSGPFPTEQDNAIGNTLRERGREYGTTTGRPRRCGWFDALAVRYAADLSGVDELAISLLMDGPGEIETMRICTGYQVGGKILREYDPALDLGSVQCVYEDFPCWKTPIGPVREYDRLPAEAHRYIERIEQLIGRPVGLISVGPDRRETIRHNSLLQGLD